MALFSEGGTTLPDITVLLTLLLLMTTSTLLNPLVFLYNYRKPLSVPSFLYQVLALFDTLTCLIIPLNSGLYIMKVEEDPCNGVKVTTWRQILTVVIWDVMYTPVMVVSVLTICRYIKIRYPFKILKVKLFVVLAIAFQIYLVSISSWMTFGREASFMCNYGMVIVRNFLNLDPAVHNLVHSWPNLICQFASLGASALTIAHLIKVRRNSLSASSNRNGMRSSARILTQNFGGILQTTAQIAKIVLLTQSRGGKSDPRYMTPVMFSVNIMTCVVLSVFNPVVFVLFTPKVLKIKAAAVQQDSTRFRLSSAVGGTELTQQCATSSYPRAERNENEGSVQMAPNCS